LPVKKLRLARAAGEVLLPQRAIKKQRDPEQSVGARRRLQEITMSSYSIRQRANAQFRTLPAAEDGNGGNGAKEAQSDFEAAADALEAKIARLKELRLARDAAVLAAPPAAPVKKAGKKKMQKPRKKQKTQQERTGISLLDWMKSRHVVG
jgi:hypothetical protein